MHADVLIFMFDRDGFYARMADRLLDTMPWHRRWPSSHSLCRQLDRLAVGLDPGTYAKQVGRPTAEGLLALGFPRFVATTLGAGAGQGLRIALGNTPLGDLVTALRVLTALVCPDLAACPTQREVVKTIVSPGLAEQLRTMATSRPEPRQP